MRLCHILCQAETAERWTGGAPERVYLGLVAVEAAPDTEQLRV
jgi:hypothetical protein